MSGLRQTGIGRLWRVVPYGWLPARCRFMTPVMRWLLDAIVLLIGVAMMPFLAIVLWAL